MSSKSEVQATDYGGVTSAFENLSGQFNGYMTKAYDWAKGQWKDANVYSDKIQKVLLDATKSGAQWAKQDRAMYDQSYKPIEQAYLKQVANFDTPARREQEAARAYADVSNTAQDNADEAKRQLAISGIKPTDLRMGALDTGVRLAKTAMGVGAAEGARRGVENTGLMLKSGVIPMGNQTAMRAMQGQGNAANVGATGTSVGNTTDATYGQLMGTPTQWGQLNTAALSGWNTALDSQQKGAIAVNEANSKGSGGFGKLAGTLIGGAAGAYFGGPAGAMAGASIGGSAGGALSGAEGGVVPYDMSPSGGAQTDDIPAVIPGGGGQPPTPAQINAGEFIFDRESTMYYGSKYLKGLQEKAHKALGLTPQDGSPAGAPVSGATGQAPPPGVIPASYDMGGMVDPGQASFAIPGLGGGDPGGITVTRGASQQLMPTEKTTREKIGEYLRAASMVASAAAPAQSSPQRSALDIYKRYAEGGVVDTRPFDDERDPRTGLTIPLGRGEVNIGGRFDDTMREIEGGYDYPINDRLSIGVRGSARQYEGDPRLDYGVGVHGRLRFANGGRVDPTDPAGPPLQHFNSRDEDYPGIEDDYPIYAPDDPLARQVDSGERKTRSDTFRYRMAFDMGPKGTPGRREEQDRRAGMPPEQEYEEQAAAKQARDKIDEFHRRYVPSSKLPGGVPGYARGGVVVPDEGQTFAPMPYDADRIDPEVRQRLIAHKSWDRDPDIKPVPGNDDAFDAVRYRRAYGNPNERNIEVGDRYRRDDPDIWDIESMSGRFDPGMPYRPLTPGETDYMRRGELVANQMPGSHGRFDPKRTSLSGDHRMWNVGGMASSKNNQVWLDPKRSPTNVGHELQHLGYFDIQNDPAGRELLAEMDKKFVTREDIDKGLDIHELLVRSNMQRNYGGEVEGKLRTDHLAASPGTTVSYGGAQYQIQRANELNKDPEFARYMRKLDQIAAHQNAQRLIDRQGGVVR